ncbi:MAG: response regulator, partial [Kamptonema sp. SIO4C4]|nr:response regulator [Kamptonema sp. SIO4C4]
SGIMAEQLTRYLSDIGLKTIIYPNGEEVVSLALNIQPKVIILDLNLPQFSGWTVLERLQSHADTRDIPVIMVSIEDEHRQAEAKGVQGYLTKPIQRSQLYTLLSQVLSLATPHPAPTSSPASPVQDCLASILIAHEEPTSIATLWDYLNAKHYALSYAQTGKAVLEQVEQHSPDLIVLELPVAAVDDVALIQQLRCKYPAIPIIVLTTATDLETRDHCLDAGATAYFAKPIRLQHLSQAIAEQLQS